MPRQIMIEFDLGSGEDALRHRVLNFNDALFVLARDDEWLSFSLDQIDKATGQCVGVKSVRRAVAKVERLIKRHGLSEVARLTVMDTRARAKEAAARKPLEKGRAGVGDQRRRS